MLEARTGVGSIKSFPRPGVKSKLAVTTVKSTTGLQNKTFHCETCDVHVNSETQLKQVRGTQEDFDNSEMLKRERTSTFLQTEALKINLGK